MGGWENSKQIINKREEQILGIVERVYSRIQYLERKEKLGKCKKSSWGIQERILVRHRGCSKTRTEKRNIQKRRITRKVYGEKII